MRGRHARALALVGLFVLAAGVRPAWAGAADAQSYDAYFRKYTKRYFGIGFDWRFFKAQGLVESGLNPEAVSRVGARGVMQMMPGTFKAVQLRNPEIGDISDAQWNIAAGIAYAHRLWTLWRGNVETDHLLEFTLGSYNAGRGTLLRAQRMAEAWRLNHRIWPSIEMVAPAVPGWQYQETVNYVLRVFEYLGDMDSRGRIIVD
jgi:membrane-bound lytic murein transglycosylase MltF